LEVAMSELSSDARALIEAEAASDAPTPNDKARVRARLATELGAGVFAGAAIVGAAHSGGAVIKSAGAVWLQGAAKLMALAGAAGTLYAGVTWLREPSHVLKAQRAVSAAGEERELTKPIAEPSEPPDFVARSASAPSGAVQPEAEGAPDVAQRAPRTRASAPAAARTTTTRARSEHPSEPTTSASTTVATPVVVEPTSISGELALLAKAQRALRSGDAKQALALAREHARSFADGALTEERTGIETLARCMLGEDAVEAARAFLEHAPSSPLAGRVREECKLR
jgi:hypothetical protein